MQHEFPKLDHWLPKLVQQINYRLHVQTLGKYLCICPEFAPKALELLCNAGYDACFDENFDCLTLQLDKKAVLPVIERVIPLHEWPSDVIVPRTELVVASRYAVRYHAAYETGVFCTNGSSEELSLVLQAEGFKKSEFVPDMLEQENTCVQPLYSELNRMLTELKQPRSGSLLWFEIGLFHIEKNLNALRNAGYEIVEISEAGPFLSVKVQHQEPSATEKTEKWDFHRYHTEVVPANVCVSNANALQYLSALATALKSSFGLRYIGQSVFPVEEDSLDSPECLQVVTEAGYTVYKKICVDILGEFHEEESGD